MPALELVALNSHSNLPISNVYVKIRAGSDNSSVMWYELHPTDYSRTTQNCHEEWLLRWTKQIKGIYYKKQLCLSSQKEDHETLPLRYWPAVRMSLSTDFSSLPSYWTWSIAKLHFPSLSRSLHRGKATPVTSSGHGKANIWEVWMKALHEQLLSDLMCNYSIFGRWSPMSQNSHCLTELTATDPWAISWMSKLAVTFSLAQMCTSIDEFIPFTTEHQHE